MIYADDAPAPTHPSTLSDEGNSVPSEARDTPQAPPPILAAGDAPPTTPSESTIPYASSASIAYSVSSDPSVPPDFDRDHRRCCICSHPDRDAIEGDFVRWRSPRNIARNYKIADHSSLYRHAHATGLFARRRREFARVLEDILEMVEHSTLEETADVIIRASRVYARLDENGNWIEPTRKHIILTGPAPGLYPENSDLEISAEPAGRPHDIPFKLASKLTENEKANKRLIATHPSSENGPNS